MLHPRAPGQVSAALVGILVGDKEEPSSKRGHGDACASAGGVWTATLASRPLREGRAPAVRDYESILSRSGRAVAARRQPERNAQTKNGRGSRGEARGDEGRRGAKQREINPSARDLKVVVTYEKTLNKRQDHKRRAPSCE